MREHARALLSRVRAREAFRHTMAHGQDGSFIVRIVWRGGWVAELDGAGAGFSTYSRRHRLTRRLSVTTLPT